MHFPRQLALVGWCVLGAVRPYTMGAQSTITGMPRLHVQLDAAVVDATSNTGSAIHGVMRVRLPRATAARARTLHLDVGGRTSTDAPSAIRIDSIRAAGARIVRRVHDTTARIVSLSLVRTAGDSAALSVYFATPIPAQPDPSLGYRLWDARETGQYWYPRPTLGRALSDAYADYDVTLSHPDSLTALLSGRLTQTRRDAITGRTIDTFVASDLEGVALALGNGFRLTQAEFAGVQVNLFDRATPDSTIGEVVAATGAALEWYVRRLGFFPHEAIGILPGLTRAIGGSPLPGIFTIHRGYTARAFLEEITAHELGHFYWGQGVLGAPQPGALNWLMLGNSIWADQLYLTERRGIAFDAQWYSPEMFNMPERFLAAQVGDFEQRLGLTGAARDSVQTDYGGAIAHAKASIGIALLARHVDVERFLTLQHQLIRKYWHRELTRVEYSRELAQAGIPDAPRWLAAWERGDARVGYQVQSITRVAFGDSNRVTVVTTRTGTIDSPLTIALVDRDGGTHRRLVAGRAQDTLMIDLPTPLDRVEVDPDGALPMASSGGWRVQGALARAMISAGHGTLALELARQQILRTPQDTLTRSALVARLAALGSWEEVRIVMLHPLAPHVCTNRVSCQSLAHLARALALTGDRATALSMLAQFETQRYRFGAVAEWRAARAAIVLR